MRFQTLAFLLVPLSLWALYFLLIYITQSIGCALDWHQQVLLGSNMLRVILVAQFIICAGLSLLAALYLYARRTAGEPMQSIELVALLCAVAALPATIISFPGVFWLSLCI